MLKWALKARDSDSNIIPMQSFDFVRSTSALKRRKEGDAELWLLLSKVLVTQLNTR